MLLSSMCCACEIVRFEHHLRESAQRVWDQLGPAHSEHIYERALETELRCDTQYTVTSQFAMGVPYRASSGHTFWLGSVAADIMVQCTDSTNAFVLEIKSTAVAKTSDAKPKLSDMNQLSKYARLLGGHVTGYLVVFPQASSGICAQPDVSVFRHCDAQNQSF